MRIAIVVAAALALSGCFPNQYLRAPPGQYAWYHLPDSCGYHFGTSATDAFGHYCEERKPLCVDDHGHEVDRAHCVSDYAWHFNADTCPSMPGPYSSFEDFMCKPDRMPHCRDHSGREFEPAACNETARREVQ